MALTNGHAETAARATVVVQKPKKKAAEKKAWKSNPFLQNFDHLEDVAFGYLNGFVQSIVLPRDKELAYRICQVLEEAAIEHEKKLAPHKGTNGHKHALAAELDELELEEENETPDHNEDDGESLYFKGLSETFPAGRKKQLNGHAPKRRYAGNRYNGIARADWAAVKKYFADRATALPARTSIKKGANPNHDNLMRLCESLGIMNDEKRLMEALLAMHFTSRTQHFFFTVTGADKNSRGQTGMRHCLARAIGVSTTRLAEMLKSDSPLRNKGLLDYNGKDSPERTFGLPYIDDSIQNIIQEPGITLPQMIGRILGAPKTTVRNWSDFEGLGEQATQIRRFVEGRIRERKGANILLVGSVGLGKSDMVKALCKQLNVPLYIPGEDATDIDDMDGRPLPPAKVRFDAWRQGISFLAASGKEGEEKRGASAMFLDEVGDLLEGNGQGRQQDGSYGSGNLSRLDLHDTIENSGIITFFAGNNQTKWDTGFLSRMDLAVFIRMPDYKYSRTIWNTVVQEHGMQEAFKADDIEKLAAELEIPPRLMQKAVTFAKTVGGGLADAMFYLEQQCEFLYEGIENVRTRLPETAPFYPELLTPADPAKISADEIIRRIDAAKSKPVTIMINGPDGTGKRRLAERFTLATGRRARTVVMEDVLGKAYDDTRAKIVEIFESAARDEVVLQMVGMDAVVDARVAAENPAVGFACRHLADALKRSKVPVILTTRHDRPEAIAGEVASSFAARAQLGFLNDAQLARGIELFAGKSIPAKVKETEVTPADIEDAVREMSMFDLPQKQLGTLIERSVKARRTANSFPIGFTNPR